jgi:amino acid transporter
MFGTLLIVVSGVGYKLIYRTKLRDLATVDLQTGRRPLSVEEIVELDQYAQSSVWRRFYSFIQLW